MRAARPDLRVAHFTHTPFCGPNSIRVLPTAVATQLRQRDGAVPCGFHTQPVGPGVRRVRARDARPAGTEPPTFAASLGPDPDALREVADSPRPTRPPPSSTTVVGDRRVILRIDRIDPSKNIVRGLRGVRPAARRASRMARAAWCSWRCSTRRAKGSRSTSRTGKRSSKPPTPSTTVGHASTGQPVVVDARDDFPRSVAGLVALRRAAREPDQGRPQPRREGGAARATNATACVCLSPEAGRVRRAAGRPWFPVHPFDVEHGAHALHDSAWSWTPTSGNCARSACASSPRQRTPRNWLADQIHAAG